MNRRDFLLGATTAAGMTTLNCPSTSAAPAAVEKIWRGVNLGGWLALEKWIAPAPYEGVDAGDEYTLCSVLGKSAATERLKRHRDTWITADDFKWIADRGLNAVRLPVGYGILEDNPPFITGTETLNRAFAQAKANGLGVLLDLHGAPGSQNGMDHSGRSGKLEWHTSKANIAHTVQIIDGLAAYCKQFDNLIGLEMLNEPRWDVPIDIIKGYYLEAYQPARKHLPKETAIVIHDAFRSSEWKSFMQEPDYSNVMLDTHLYQCYTDGDRKNDIHAHVEIAGLEWKRQIDRMQQDLPTIVGEWSCSLDPQSLRGLTGFSHEIATRAYADAQLISFEKSRGWFYWTYKIASGGTWSFRDCVKRGWMPEQYGDTGLIAPRI
jgi:glucan 1,3-beta-glucosidase